uniref:RING-type domain-containing protein n=1 Tax=Bos taurus TaxID=9913 RepID=A0AAA9T314_BOVIN
MASWVFCNRCFQPPQATSCFSLTNCGHVYCDACLRKGKRDECLICKVACRTVLLSKHTDPNIQALFMGVDSLCMKYAKETSQISEFQEKHRRRLLAFYGEKISQLEESLRKSTLRVEQLQRVRSSQQTSFSTGNTTASTPSAKPSGPLLFQPRGSSASERVESMEVDLMPSPRRKPEVATGPPRISLLSPPRDGRMGSIAHRPQHLGLTPRCSSEPQSPSISTEDPGSPMWMLWALGVSSGPWGLARVTTVQSRPRTRLPAGHCSCWTRGPRLSVCPWKLRSSRPLNDHGVKGTADFIYQICC